MALWGNKDTVYSTGNVNLNVTTGALTRQSGTINWSTIAAGDVVTVADDGAGVGEGVVVSVDTATGNSAQLTMTTANLPGTNFTNVGYEIRQKPKFTIGDSNYASGEIFGVDAAEQAAARDDNSQYRPAHAGWVGITSYTDMHGNQRVKTEVLVAASTISGTDADDDTILPDT